MNLSKEIKFQPDVLQCMIEGTNELANTVKSTLGPKGRYVVIERGQGYPKSTKDGVSVAKEIFFDNPYKNLGAQMIKQVAIKSCDEAGDGTTTATVLAQALINKGYKAIQTVGNPVWIKKGMEKACYDITKELENMAIPVNSTNDIRNIATISANNDRNIGDLIASAMEQIGEYGSITVAESTTGKTELEVVSGMSTDQGLLSPYLINNYEKMDCEFQDCQLLLVDGKVVDFDNQIAKYIDYCANTLHKPLVILAEDFSNDVLANIIYWATPDVKSKRMGFDLSVAKAPGFGNRRLQLLEDIAALTDATVITKDKGLILGETDMNVFGGCEKIVIKQFETSIYGGYGSKEAVEERIKYLQGQIASAMCEADKEPYIQRLAKLTGGMAVIKAGGNSDLEIKEVKDRLDDAISAAKSAKEEGIVPGGGTALYLISKELKPNNATFNNNNEMEFNYGYNLVLEAIQEPIKTILTNAGEDVSEILININKKQGYDALTGSYVDLIDEGIIDPTKVVRCALQNAISVASVLLTTSAAIVTDRNAKEIK